MVEGVKYRTNYTNLDDSQAWPDKALLEGKYERNEKSEGLRREGEREMVLRVN